MRLFLLFIVLSFVAKAQNFSFQPKTYANGFEAPMKGIPGDLFMTILTFSNSGSTDISIFINRYQKSIPPYWRSCYCYTVCSDPTTDTIRISVKANSTTDITIQFKTDSVNPGLATSKLNIYQIGFQNKSQELALSASTLGDVGIKELQNKGNLIIYPNPTKNFITISASDLIKNLSICDQLGRRILSSQTNDSKLEFDVSEWIKGIYFVVVDTEVLRASRILIVE